MKETWCEGIFKGRSDDDDDDDDDDAGDDDDGDDDDDCVVLMMMFFFNDDYGVRQGCVLSPRLFCAVLKCAMRKWRNAVGHAGIDLMDGGSKFA